MLPWPGNPWPWLGWQVQPEFVQQEGLLGLGLRIPGHDQPTAVGGRPPDIQHLDGRQLIQDGSRRQPGRVGLESLLQRDHPAIGQESDDFPEKLPQRGGSEVLPSLTSSARGKPSGVITRAITTCRQSGR
jgi:hypothetical protein